MQQKRKPRHQDLAHLQEEFRKEDKLLHESLDYIKKHVDKLWEYTADTKDRLQDLEIQVNLITRLLTALCLEVLRMKPKALRRMIKHIEEEAIADSQVMHLEELFRLEPKEKKEGRKEEGNKPKKGD